MINKLKILSIFTLLIFFILTPNISAYEQTKGNYTITYDIVNYTPQCGGLKQCELLYYIIVNQNYTIPNENKFKHIMLDILGEINPGIVSNLKLTYLKNNATWLTFNPTGKTLIENTYYYFNVSGYKSPFLKVDIIPSIAEFNLSEMIWWNQSFNYSNTICVRSPDGSNISSGHVVNVTIPHSAWVSLSQSNNDGSDITITWGNVSSDTHTILHRDNITKWDNGNTTIRFRTQENTTIAESCNYSIWHDNITSNQTLDNTSFIVDFRDDFTHQNTIDNFYSSSGTPNVGGGEVVLLSGEGISLNAGYLNTSFITRWESKQIDAGNTWLGIDDTNNPFELPWISSPRESCQFDLYRAGNNYTQTIDNDGAPPQDQTIVTFTGNNYSINTSKIFIIDINIAIECHYANEELGSIIVVQDIHTGSVPNGDLILSSAFWSNNGEMAINYVETYLYPIYDGVLGENLEVGDFPDVEPEPEPEEPRNETILGATPTNTISFGDVIDLIIFIFLFILLVLLMYLASKKLSMGILLVLVAGLIVIIIESNIIQNNSDNPFIQYTFLIIILILIAVVFSKKEFIRKLKSAGRKIKR